MLANVYNIPSLAVNLGGQEANPTPMPHGGSERSSWPQLELGKPKVIVLGRSQEVSRRREKRLRGRTKVLGLETGLHPRPQSQH